MDVKALAESYKLGELIKEFAIDKKKLNENSSNSSTTGITLLILGAITGLAVIYAGFANGDSGSRNLGMGLIVVSLAIGIPLTLQGRNVRRAGNVHVFERGLLETCRPTPKVLEFSDVYSIWQEIKKGVLENPYDGRIEAHSGEVFRFKLLKDPAGLAELVQQQVLPFQLPATLEAWQAGETVKFGDWVSLTPEGINVNRKTLIPYDDFERLDFKMVAEKAASSGGGGIEGAIAAAAINVALSSKVRAVVFHYSGGEASVKERFIPNLTLLQTMLKKIQESRAQNQS